MSGAVAIRCTYGLRLYGGEMVPIPAIARPSRTRGYWDVSLLEDPGFGSLYQSATGGGNIRWLVPEGVEADTDGWRSASSVESLAEAENLRDEDAFWRAHYRLVSS